MSAPAASTASTSAPSRAKSADRMEGAIQGVFMARFYAARAMAARSHLDARERPGTEDHEQRPHGQQHDDVGGRIEVPGADERTAHTVHAIGQRIGGGDVLH